MISEPGGLGKLTGCVSVLVHKMHVDVLDIRELAAGVDGRFICGFIFVTCCPKNKADNDCAA